MSDNSTLPAAGEVVRSIEKGGAKSQVMLLDVGTGTTEKLVGAYDLPVALADIAQNIRRLVELQANPIHILPDTGAMRVGIVSGSVGIAASQTLATVTTLTSMNQVAGVPANTLVLDSMMNNWANTVRGRVV